MQLLNLIVSIQLYAGIVPDVLNLVLPSLDLGTVLVPVPVLLWRPDVLNFSTGTAKFRSYFQVPP